MHKAKAHLHLFSSPHLHPLSNVTDNPHPSPSLTLMTQARQQLLYFSFSVSWDKKTLLKTQDPSSQRTVVLDAFKSKTDAFKSKTCRHLCKLRRTVPLDPNASSAVQTDTTDDDSHFSDHSPLTGTNILSDHDSTTDISCDALSLPGEETSSQRLNPSMVSWFLTKISRQFDDRGIIF